MQNNLQAQRKTNIYRNKSGVGQLLPYFWGKRCQESTNVVLCVSYNLTFECYATSAKVSNIKYLHYKMQLQISKEEQIRERLQK